MIRKALPQDADRLAELRCELLEVISGNEVSQQGREIIKTFFGQKWKGENPMYFVFELNQEITGMAAIALFPGMPSEKNPTGHCALIYDVMVSETNRQRGIGRQLLQQVLRYCQQQRVGFIHLNASDMGKGIYKSLGFVEYYACPEMRMYYNKLQELNFE